MITAAPVNVLLVEDNPGDARLTCEMLADVRTAQFCVVQTATLADEPSLHLREESKRPVHLDL